MLLIDDRTSPPGPPDPERRVIEPDWRLCFWVVASVALLVACFMTEGILSVVLVFSAIACTVHAWLIALPWESGMRDHRQ